MCEHSYSDKAQIVSSCYARRCHPETCCCDDDEYAIMDYSVYQGHSYYGVIRYGTKRELTMILEPETANGESQC